MLTYPRTHVLDADSRFACLHVFLLIYLHTCLPTALFNSIFAYLHRSYLHTYSHRHHVIRAFGKHTPTIPGLQNKHSEQGWKHSRADEYVETVCVLRSFSRWPSGRSQGCPWWATAGSSSCWRTSGGRASGSVRIALAVRTWSKHGWVRKFAF